MPVIELAAPLTDTIARYRFDPLGYVSFGLSLGPIRHFPAGESGPEPWQRDVLEKLGKGLMAPDEAVRVAVASGHGVGKSALVAWIILWALSTLPDTRGIVTANTEGQLRTKTWPGTRQVAGALRQQAMVQLTRRPRFILRSRATTRPARRCHHLVGEQHRGHRRPAQQGQACLRPVRRGLGHSGRVWETVEGALTDAGTDLFWAAFGNPTRTTGRFRECFAGGRVAHRWNPQTDRFRAPCP